MLRLSSAGIVFLSLMTDYIKRTSPLHSPKKSPLSPTANGLTIASMRHSLFTRCLALLLVLTFAVGSGASVPARGADVDDSSAPMMHDMSGMTMTDASAGHHGCCPSSEKHKETAKGGLCFAACAAMAQATLPAPQPVLVRHAVALVYDTVDASASGRLLLPDYPPPKA